VKNLLTVDYQQSSSSLEIFPCKPLLANQKNSFSSIKIEHYQLPPHLVPEHIPLQNAIIIFHQPIKKIERQLGESRKTERIEIGDIVISPANVIHSAGWEESISFTLLLLEREFLARAAYEFKHPDRIELLPTFARPDPLIYQIGLALQTELGKACVPSGCKNFARERPYQRMYVDTAASFLATHLIENYSKLGNATTLHNSANALSHQDLQRVDDYIDNYLDRDVGLEELANVLNMSQSYFRRLFKQTTGLSPYKYLIDRRLDKASRLLVNTNLEIAEIAELVGFSSHRNFCRIFHQYLSLSPLEYRQKF
jgi:AraC family transcriptional regulator